MDRNHREDASINDTKVTIWIGPDPDHPDKKKIRLCANRPKGNRGTHKVWKKKRVDWRGDTTTVASWKVVFRFPQNGKNSPFKDHPGPMVTFEGSGNGSDGDKIKNIQDLKLNDSFYYDVECVGIDGTRYTVDPIIVLDNSHPFDEQDNFPDPHAPGNECSSQ